MVMSQKTNRNLKLEIEGIHHWLQTTLMEEISAGINSRKFFFGHFAGINFRELGFTECPLQRFCGIKFKGCFKNIFSTALVYGFQNNLSKNYYFFT